MSLSPGTRVGPYQIDGPLGAGGMGQVYRATDLQLFRQVAIKVLPDALAGDEERLARFDREARTLAALNHPNIAQIATAGRRAFDVLPDGLIVSLSGDDTPAYVRGSWLLDVAEA